MFGRELQTLFTHLTQDRPNNQLQTLLHDSFSLLAYTDPHTSPVSSLQIEPNFTDEYVEKEKERERMSE